MRTINEQTRVTRQALQALAHRRGSATLLTVTSTLRTGTRQVVTTGTRSIRTTRHTIASPTVVSQLALSRSQLQTVTTSIHTITILPSPVNSIIHNCALPGKLQIQRIQIPLKIITVVCRTHPGIAISTTILYLGDNGTTLLQNSTDTTRDGQILVSAVQRTLNSASIPISTVYTMPNLARSDIVRLAHTHNVISIIVPHKNTKLVHGIIRGDLIPIVRANINGYRICLRRSTSISHDITVIIGSGARHIDIYGATRTLLIRRTTTRQLLPRIFTTLGRHNIAVRNSRVDRGCTRSANVSFQQTASLS